MQSKLETRSKKCKPQVQVASTDLHLQHGTCNSPGTCNFLPGFTLTELLVVIGIIAILIGLLLPVVNRVRRIAYVADTENEISQISNACNQYYSTFHAYPGPLSNDQTAGNGGTIVNPNPITMEIYTSTGGAAPTYTTLSSPWPTKWYVTGAENLVLGLMGGLRIDPGPPTGVAVGTLAFAPAEVGLGPLNLSPSFPGRTPSFFSTGSNYLMWCETNPSGVYSQLLSTNVSQTVQYNAAQTPEPFTDQAGATASDSPIPEFVDRFPSPGPMPILYLRARTGAQGVVSDGTIANPVTTATALYQYDLRDITPYTYCNTKGASIGLPVPASGSKYYHDLWALGSVTYPPSPPVTYLKSAIVPAGPPNPNPGPAQTIDSSANSNSIADAFSYFVNAAIPPTGADPNYTGRPRAVDQFILISAGPDGIYGTADDITSFGDVSQ
jgi:prepilin-type N-terminal cleavage/methylation domain-containing protein